MKHLKLLLLFACTLSLWQLKGQTGLDCNHSILIPQPYTKVFGGNSNETWYNFNATSIALELDIFESSSLVNVNKIELYSGNCSALTLLAKDSLAFNLDSIKTIIFSGLSINSNYYIKVSFIDPKKPNNYKLVLKPADIDPNLFVQNTNNGSICNIDDEDPEPITVTNPYCFVTACVGDPLLIYYGTSPYSPINHIDLAIYLSGVLVYSGSGNSTYNFTPTVPGNYLVIQTTLPLPTSGYYTGINVIVGGPNTTPLYSINPPTGPYCAGECITFASLNTNAFNTSFSTNDPSTGCPSGGPGNYLPNSFIFSNTGINTVNYTINGGSTCEQTFPIHINISTPVITISSSIPTPCSFDRIFTANLSCIPLGTSPTYNWIIYNGTSNSGSVVYTSSFASNVLNYTFPASGTY